MELRVSGKKRELIERYFETNFTHTIDIMLALDYPCMEIMSGALGPMGCLVRDLNCTAVMRITAMTEITIVWATV